MKAGTDKRTKQEYLSDFSAPITSIPAVSSAKEVTESFRTHNWRGLKIENF
jgi:hypothetical protein